MKLYDRPRIDKELDRLPELPEDVQVPDDISGLEPPTTRRATGGAIRWMRWLAAIIVFGALAVGATVLIIGDDGTTVDQADVYGSDRHLATWEDLAANRLAVDYMAVYGTDNPVFVVRAKYADTGEFLGIDTIGVTQPEYVDTGEFLGLDTIGVTQPEYVDTGEFLGGYDRPPLKLSQDMRLYGTDNPVIVEHPYADFYG